ncbi:hypothetical protein AB0M39_20225 [Streptomyces sp. NPDC051907]|uniref:hypothetical protein n=1 Tax=Streptomyces sp. NPDC051907 TaxID=3155284 RepID=UPI00341F4880
MPMLLCGDRVRRLPTAAVGLLGLLFSLLLFSLLLCTAATAHGGATAPTRSADPAVTAVAAPSHIQTARIQAQVLARPPGQAPGCGQGAPDDFSGAHPAAPPRGFSAYELLPALHDAHGVSGGCSQEQTVLDVPPGRGPPPLDPPSPVELSILRV